MYSYQYQVLLIRLMGASRIFDRCLAALVTLIRAYSLLLCRRIAQKRPILINKIMPEFVLISRFTHVLKVPHL